MVDTIIVRGTMPVQRTNQHRELAVPEKPPVALCEEDYDKLQEVVGQFDQLRSQTAFYIPWRRDAEADYANARKQIVENETLVSKVAVTASRLEESQYNILQRLGMVESELTTKVNQLDSHTS